ncbi:hypothetical protein BaRGS_00037611 [Batillaria attramentaria]|uniref:TauD/TfdA-like domain-containing protein n=1 Tax=Batillaria attramentaria TaxID=370345 RepID=A0ABD0J959_9CAEN
MITRYSHPFFYSHPVIGHPTLCFHNGATDGFVWDYKTERERYTDRSETWQLVQEIHREITKDNNRLVYSHKWEVGDFIVADNLALAHQASPESQLPVSEVGLRILHRTAVEGKWRPRKDRRSG